jgi:hypothetical protein
VATFAQLSKPHRLSTLYRAETRGLTKTAIRVSPVAPTLDQNQIILGLTNRPRLVSLVLRIRWQTPGRVPEEHGCGGLNFAPLVEMYLDCSASAAPEEMKEKWNDGYHKQNVNQPTSYMVSSPSDEPADEEQNRQYQEQEISQKPHSP